MPHEDEPCPSQSEDALNRWLSTNAGRSRDVLDDVVERYRREQLFEAADVAYRRAGTKKDRDLDAWENALADGLREG